MAVILEGNVSIFFIGQEASRLMRDSSTLVRMRKIMQNYYREKYYRQVTKEKDDRQDREKKIIDIRN